MGFLSQVLMGMILGIVVGLALGPEHMDFINTWIVPVGTIFYRLLRVMIIPLVVSSLIVGVTGFGNIFKFIRIGGKIFVLSILTSVVAACLGIAIGVIFEPGVGVALQATEHIDAKTIPAFSQMIIDFFPYNPVRSMVDENMIQLIIFSVAIGIGILACGEKSNLISEFAEQVTRICYKVVGGIMKMAPVGICALLIPTAAGNGKEIVMPLFNVVMCMYFSLFLQVFFVYGGLLKFVAGIDFFKFLKRIFPVAAFAFSNCTSVGTLPVTMTYCRKMNVSKEVASFTLPLGATVHMDGTAIYIALGAVFLAQVSNVQLTFFHYVSIVFMSILVAFSAAAVPGQAVTLLMMALATLGLPLEGMALIISIDRIWDMGVTALNVVGDMVICDVVAKSEGEKLVI